jgi:hypothetical protein
MNLWTMPQLVKPTVIVRVLVRLPYAIDDLKKEWFVEPGLECKRIASFMAMTILSTASLKLLANSLDRLFTPSIILTHAESLQG